MRVLKNASTSKFTVNLRGPKMDFVCQKGADPRNVHRRSVHYRRPNVVPIYTSTRVQFGLQDPIQPLVPKQAPREAILCTPWLFEICYRIQVHSPFKFRDQSP